MRVPVNNPAYSFGRAHASKCAAEANVPENSEDKAKKPNNSWKKYFAVGGVGIPLTALAAKVLLHSYADSQRKPVQLRPQPDPPPIKIPPLDVSAAIRAIAVKTAEDLSLGRVLGTSLAATGGGLLLGSYPGMKLQQASESAGNPDFVSFGAGKLPIIFAGSLSAGLYNYMLDQMNKKKQQELNQEPESMKKYLKYLVY